MPKLAPLGQWFCDTCGEIINAPEDGYLEWKTDDDLKMYGFKVEHHVSKSPRARSDRGCYYPSNNISTSSMPLKDALGIQGLVEVSSWIDWGKEFTPEYRPFVVDLREWTTLFRRLHVPYYEEARYYFEQARSEDYSDANAIFFYKPETLKEIIEKYEGDDRD